MSTHRVDNPQFPQTAESVTPDPVAAGAPAGDAGPQRRALLAGLGGLAAGAFLASKASAGPLNPPPGPITPTGKTLTEIEPRTAITSSGSGSIFITQPGSYYLTGDVNLGGNRIVIDAQGVTLDLNGFSVNQNTDSVEAIFLTSNAADARVHNGRIAHFGAGDPVGIRSVVPSQLAVFEDLTITHVNFTPGGSGIVAQNLAVVRRVHCTGAWDTALALTVVGHVQDCTIVGAINAISVGDSGVIERCQAIGTGTTGTGFRALRGGRVSQCSASFFARGVELTDFARVEHTAIYRCSSRGVLVGTNSTVADCTIGDIFSLTPGGIGIEGLERLRVERCQINGCRESGITNTRIATTVLDCSLEANGYGVNLVGPATVERCRIANNAREGVLANRLTRVADCHFEFNGPAAIRLTEIGPGAGSHIDRCTITRHPTAIVIDASAGAAVTRCMFNGNSANIVAGAGVFQLVVSPSTGANTATNPMINLVV